MNRFNYPLIIVAIGCLLLPVASYAYDFPAVYSKNVNDPATNATVISEYLTSTAKNSQQAELDARRAHRIQENIATSLYAEALATRIKIIQRSKANALKSKTDAIGGGLKDSRTVLQEQVLVNVGNIAERLNDIVSLEAGLADLEGTTILISMPKSRSSLVEEKDDETSMEEEGK